MCTYICLQDCIIEAELSDGASYSSRFDRFSVADLDINWYECYVNGSRGKFSYHLQIVEVRWHCKRTSQIIVQCYNRP